MLRVTTIALLLVAATLPAVAQERLAYPAVDLRGALYRAVFVSATGALTERDLAALPDDVRARLTRFLASRATLAQAGEGTPPDSREFLEHSIIALIDREDARTLAADFLRRGAHCRRLGRQRRSAAERGELRREAPETGRAARAISLRVHCAATTGGVRAGGSREGPRDDEGGRKKISRRHAARPIGGRSHLRALGRRPRSDAVCVCVDRQAPGDVQS